MCTSMGIGLQMGLGFAMSIVLMIATGLFAIPGSLTLLHDNFSPP